MKYCFSLVALIALTACGIGSATSTSGGGSGSTSTTFTLGTAWSITAEPGQGTAHRLLSGYFNADNNTYLDLALLTSTGVFIYANRASDDENGWNTGFGRIAATQTASYFAGAATDLDYNNNNLSDLILVRNASEIETFLNTSTGSSISFAEQVAFSFVPVVNWIELADFETRDNDKNDDDGENDNQVHFALGADGVGNHRTATITRGVIQGASVAAQPGALTSVVRVLAGDMDGDGDQDFALIGTTGIEFLVNNDDTSFTRVDSVIASESLAGTVQDAVLGDIDLDGTADILVATNGGFNAFINETTIANTFVFTNQSSSLSMGATINSTSFLNFVDLTEDGRADILISRSTGAPLLLTNAGSGFRYTDITTNAFSSANLPNDIQECLVMDVDGDRVPDIVMRDNGGNIVTFFNNADDGNDAD